MGPEEEMRYAGDKTAHAAAAAKLWTEHWTSGPGQDALWRMVTRCWSRRTVRVLVDCKRSLPQLAMSTVGPPRALGICVWGGDVVVFRGLVSPLYGDVE